MQLANFRTLLVLFTFLICCIFYACRRDDFFSGRPSKSFDVAAAKKFYKGMIKEQGREVSNPLLQVGIQPNKKYVMWKKGYVSSNSRFEFVEAPLYYNQKISSNIYQTNGIRNKEADQRIFQAALNRLVVFKNKQTGEAGCYIVNYIPSKEYLDEAGKDISVNQINRLQKNFSGFIKYSTWNGDPVKAFEVKKGKVVHRLKYGKVKTAQQNSSVSVNSQSVNGAGTAPVVNAYICEYYTDEIEYTECWTIDPETMNVACEGFRIQISYEVCYEDDPWDPESNDDPCMDPSNFDLPMCGGGGGTGDPGDPGGYVPPVSVNEVINNLTNPCLVAVVTNIGNAKLKSEIIKLYQQTFVGRDKEFNVKFEQAPNLTSGGLPIPGMSNVDPASPTTWVITLNSSFLAQGIGTRESWTQTIFHELVHGFIRQNGLDFSATSSWSAEHEEMLTDWILQMKDGLIDICGMNATDALALALGGMDDIVRDGMSPFFLADWVDFVNDKYNIDLQDASDIEDDYLDGTKGTACD